MSGYLLTTGCMTTPALPEPQRPQHWGQPIHQNHNFHQISNFVYRSEQPSTELIPLLKQHKIDVVINLRSRDQDSFVLSNENFQLHHVPIHTWAIDREDLLKIMLLIQQAQQNHQRCSCIVITVQTALVQVSPCTELFLNIGRLSRRYRK